MDERGLRHITVDATQDLKRVLPELPLLCDPSHICGSTKLIHDVSQKALDLNYDGLIIESHIDPAQAWSDAGQQVTPDELCGILEKLVLRRPSSDNPVFLHTLEELRAKIDMYDDQLIDLLEHRMKVSETIGRYKKENSITILQPKRWEEVVRKSVEKGTQKGLSAEFVDTLLKAIHDESINHQMKIMNEPEKDEPSES
jgi:chorismate mutase